MILNSAFESCLLVAIAAGRATCIDGIKRIGSVARTRAVPQKKLLPMIVKIDELTQGLVVADIFCRVSLEISIQLLVGLKIIKISTQEFQLTLNEISVNAPSSASAARNCLCDGFLFHVVEESLKCGEALRVDCREASFVVNMRQPSLDFNHQLVASVVLVIRPSCAALISVGVSNWTFANAG